MMKDRIRNALNSLQTRLTLTYMIVTVAALLVLEILLLGGLMGVMSSFRVNESEYLLNVILLLTPKATDYFERNDLDGMQEWASDQFESGYASEQPQEVGDSAAASFAKTHPFLILDAQGKIQAMAPHNPESVGQLYTPPPEIDSDWFNEQAAVKGFGTDLFNAEVNPLEQFKPLRDGSWYVVIPVQSTSGSKVWGSMVLNILPAPAFLTAFLPVFGSILGWTALLLLIGVLPLGALFGYVMARNITRRLANLETVADAYSQGDFSVVPQDGSKDEIGRLGARFKQMAGQIENLLENRQELAALEERNRLARELHDTVKQQNFATIMQVRAAKNLAKKGESSEVALEHLEIAEDLLKQSQQDLKGTIEELRPVQLDGHGLPTALRQFAKSWSIQSNITADVAVTGERMVPIEIEQTLYRITQEALANIERHSSAQHVDLQLSYSQQAIQLTIKDDGQGFDTESAKRGFGLSTMQQRITEINGQLDILSKPTEGTAVSAEVKL